ncbi:glycosyltransferase family 2 protein [Bacteroides acidifaciens]|uniref:glycosyltransferase family 2 protein n=1 Tax=Bacteroides acidifaciens TaxID=85831 RepID=UPI0025A9A692|nr:glycosyltransferase family 2 protein [Bacteroides acidifaciens]
MKVSFVIPVYKVEQYIDRCVKSIANQTYRNIEIILVDDGSPDACPALCDQYASEDFRIKTIHKENGGLSDARNLGTKEATGDYLIYVDSDDFWMHDDDLEKLVRIASVHPTADFIGFNCSYYYANKNVFSPWKQYDLTLSIPKEKNVAIKLLTSTSSMVMSAWMKMIKREFLIHNKLFFIKGQLSEDIPWFINLLDCCHECMFVNLNVYAYRQGVSGSITHNITLKNIDSLINIVETELRRIDSRSFNEEAKNCIMSFLAYEYSIILGYLQFLDKNVATSKYEYLKQYKYLLKYTQDPKVKKVNLCYRLLGLRKTTYLLQWKMRKVMK